MRTSALDTFRICLGTVMLGHFAYLTQGWTLAWEWLSQTGFHVPSTLLPGMPVAPLLPEALVPWFGVLFFASLLAWTLGFHLRWTSLLALFLVAYVTWADILTHYSINRIFIISLTIMTFAAWDRSSSWPLRVLQIFLVTMYFVAGWSKAVHGDWLTSPITLWTQLQIYYMNSWSAQLVQELPIAFWKVIQWGVVAFELSAPVLFFNRKFLPAAFVLGIALHLGIGWLMQDVISFGLAMLCFYPLFIKPGPQTKHL